MSDCIFCKIINKEAKANIIFENKKCLVFTPFNAIIKGHVLIIPKVHYQDIFGIDDITLSDLMIVTKKLANDLLKDNQYTGINILQASGKDAQQSVFHFHIHLVPRHPNDGLDLWFRNKL